MLNDETKHLYTPAINHVVDLLGKTLREDNPRVAFQLRIMIHVTNPEFGPEWDKDQTKTLFVTKCLAKTGQVVMSGAVPEIKYKGQTRKRTRGGVFFSIAKDEMEPEVREKYMSQLEQFGLRTKPKTKPSEMNGKEQ